MADFIYLKGVRTHNLQGIDIRIPLRKITAVTGRSGSGKSSLVFHTLYAESYRRYSESLSSFARQYLEKFPKPEVTKVVNLLPSIAVRQNTGGGAYTRSTIASLTEIDDYLQVLFQGEGRQQCPECDVSIEFFSVQTAAQKIWEIFDKKKVYILAALEGWKEIQTDIFKSQLEEQGFSRVLEKGKVVRLSSLPHEKILQCFLVIDRLTINKENKNRLLQALPTAFALGKGLSIIQDIGNLDRKILSNARWCVKCQKKFKNPISSHFNSDHPLGACPSCQGYGREYVLDWGKIIPDQQKSLKDHPIVPWNFGKHVLCYEQAERSSKKHHLTCFTKPLYQFSESEWLWLKEGDNQEFTGIFGYFSWLNRQKYKTHARVHRNRFYTKEVCLSCHGKKLRKESLSYYIDKKNIADIFILPIKDVEKWAQICQKRLLQSPIPSQFLIDACEEILKRLDYLIQVGLSYLTLNRATSSLSGGEKQRIHLARCLSNSLTNTLYCLDEPSSGLHSRDIMNLFKVILRLKEQGNTIVIIEHERQIIDLCDYLIHLGPHAGHLGGKILYQGSLDKKVPSVLPFYSLSKKYLSKPKLSFVNLTVHNLKNLNVEIPVESFVVICGVSGSGKSSLLEHAIYPLLKHAFTDEKLEGDLKNHAMIDQKLIRKYGQQVFYMTQQNLNTRSRSNILTYLKIYDDIRQIFSKTPQASVQGIKASYFGFNQPGGRCEVCQGLGFVLENLSFLGDIRTTCAKCSGKRFCEKVLKIYWKHLNISDLLHLTVEEAKPLFSGYKKISRCLNIASQLGLGYIFLGRETSAYSGGEAQRLKLTRIFLEKHAAEKAYLLFDEPSTGLSDEDLEDLIVNMNILKQEGHSLLIVEHHLRIIQAADWVIEMGPDAGAAGGKIVFVGRPSELVTCPVSPTAPYLRDYLERIEKSEICS